MTPLATGRSVLFVAVLAIAASLGGAASALFGVCGPFTDVSDASFCPFVLEVFTMGITTGTTPTTYDPANAVSRLQMAAFLSRTVDRTLQRGSRRAALDRYWTTQAPANLGLTTMSGSLRGVRSDGEDLWVAIGGNHTVARVHASSGKLLETWTGAMDATAVLTAMGRVFVTGSGNGPIARLYRIDPGQPAGAVTTVATDLGPYPTGIAFDGSRIWTANYAAPGSMSLVTPTVSLPWTVTTVTAGFSQPIGPLFDGANLWVTDNIANTLLKLDGNGAILQTVTVGTQPEYPVFDGSNIWVPNANASSVSVVRASSGVVLATLTGNGLAGSPLAAAFDGQRVLITNPNGNSVSLWKAADLTPIGSFGTGASTSPYLVCSDGINFWITLSGLAELGRF